MLLLQGFVLAGVCQAATVVASIQPLYLLAREVLPPEIQVERLLPAGVSPHGFQMAVSQRKLLEQAGLVVWVGPSLEPFLTPVLKGKPQLELESLETIQWPPSHVAVTNSKHAHAVDPHLWLNPENGRAIARQLVAELIVQEPQLEQSLNQTLQQFEQKLNLYEIIWRERLGEYHDQPWLVFHDSARHFEMYFELMPYQIIVTSPENRPGAKHLHQLQQQLKQGQCLLVEDYYPTRQAQRLASEFSLKKTTYDPLGTLANSYLELIENMVEQVHRCMDNT